MDSIRVHSILEVHIPPSALPYCIQLWNQYPFELRLKKKRISKVGDFTCRHGRIPRITINQDSHPFLFLLTYVHEVAHLVVHQQQGWKVEAHGTTWKKTFQDLLSPVMNEEIFPKSLLTVLRRHMEDPMASSFSDSRLTAALRMYDERQKSVTLLSEIPEGSIFGLHGRWFKKGQLRRTRVLCHELKSRRNYLVPADSPIDSAQLSLLP
jgi:SprT protein